MTSSPAAPEPSEAALAAARLTYTGPMRDDLALESAVRAAYAVDFGAAPLPRLTVERFAALLREGPGSLTSGTLVGADWADHLATFVLARLAGERAK